MDAWDRLDMVLDMRSAHATWLPSTLPRFNQYHILTEKFNRLLRRGRIVFCTLVKEIIENWIWKRPISGDSARCALRLISRPGIGPSSTAPPFVYVAKLGRVRGIFVGGLRLFTKWVPTFVAE